MIPVHIHTRRYAENAEQIHRSFEFLRQGLENMEGIHVVRTYVRVCVCVCGYVGGCWCVHPALCLRQGLEKMEAFM